MGDWPLQHATHFDTEGIASAGNTAGTIVTGGAANTKGAFAQLSSALPVGCEAIAVAVGSKSSTSDYLLDIAIGAPSSEVVVLSNLSVSGPAYNSGYFYFPISLPAGVRLSARCQCVSASATLGVFAMLMTTGFLGLPGFGRRVEALGANTADSGGVALTNPTVINTFPAWAQIGAATSFRYRWLVVAIGNQAVGSRTSGQRFIFEVGIGAAAAQRTLIGGIPIGSPTGGLGIASSYAFPCDIPAGSTLWGRYASAALTTLGADMVLYGVG